MEDARSGSDSGSKLGYNGGVLAGAPIKVGAVKAGEYRGKSPERVDPVSTEVVRS